MEYKKRLENVIDAFSEWQCDLLLVENPTDIFYLTGILLSSGKLLIGKEKFFLIVDGRYFEQCTKKAPLPYRVLLADPNNRLNDLVSREFPSAVSIAFDSAYTKYKEFLQLESSLSNKSSYRLLPIDQPITHLRRLKDPEEIVCMRKAAILGSAGFDFICRNIKEGISEIELAIELEIFWKRKGGKGVAFDPIIAFGPNSAMPHYRAEKVRLKRGDAVLIDIGVNLEHYHSDMTRMVYFGEPDAKMLEIHRIVQKAQQAALALCKKGVTVGDIDRAARAVIAEYGYEKQYPHSVGHGVGLEIHEEPLLRNTVPYKDIVLEPGMVITIEPGIYLPEIGGVRIEDMILITQEGYEDLTQRPKDPLVLDVA